jgi:hypothetical protein
MTHYLFIKMVRRVRAEGGRMKTSGWTFGARGPLIFILFNLIYFDIEPHE